jgi:tetratricopeptide (TPR) repeat protein
MSNWNEITRSASDAQKIMVGNKADGEEEFERLLRYYPNDGMIYYQRGQGFEYHEEYEKAARDLEKAEILFPMAKYKIMAREALERVREKIRKRKSK